MNVLSKSPVPCFGSHCVEGKADTVLGHTANLYMAQLEMLQGVLGSPQKLPDKSESLKALSCTAPLLTFSNAYRGSPKRQATNRLSYPPYKMRPYVCRPNRASAHAYLYVCMYIHSYIYAHKLSNYVSIYLYIDLSIYLSVYRSIYLNQHISIHVSTYPSM